MNAQIPIITANEFHQRVIDRLLHEFGENVTEETIFRYAMETGFPKFDKENLNVFLQKLQDFVFINFETVIVDIGDNDFFWVVSSINAILISKKNLTIA